MEKIIAITVSTNYDDLLKIIIPQNNKFFYKWYIITSKTDDKTLKVIYDYNYSNSNSNIEILFYDFNANNKIFNKGGAIKYCQNIISTLNYNGIVLILDSDIYLPNDFDSIINNIAISNDTLYGTYKRYDFYNYKNLQNNIVNFDYPWAKEFQGYFQLYKFNKNYLYNESFNCSACDLEFIKHFKNKIIIPNLIVSHLGKHYINWNGRKNTNDFFLS